MNNLVDESSIKETDFQSLLFSIWNSKLFILSFILLSIPVSLLHLSNTNPVYTSGAVVNISSGETKSNFSSMMQDSPLNFMLPLQQANDNSAIPEILGTEFLKIVVRESSLGEELKRRCAPGKPKLFSLTGLLNFFGITEVGELDISQRENAIVQCLGGMFDIEPYEHKNIKTSAYLIQVEDTDPLFAANLANEIIKKYFEFQEDKSKKNFKKAVKYLSDTLADASIDLKKSQEKLEDFLLQNAEVLVQSGNLPSSDPLLSTRSLKSLKQLAVLGKTEKFERGLLTIQNELEALLGEDIMVIKKFVQKVGVSGGLSRQFVGKIASSENNENLGANILSEEIKNEIKRVGRLIQANKQQSIKTGNQTAMLLAVQKNLSSLELEVERKTIYLQAISDQLTSKTVEAGASMMNESLVFSKAIPPLNPTRPNKRLVVVFFGFFFAAVATFFVIARHAIRKTIFSLNQVSDIKKIENKFEVKLARDLASLKGNNEDKVNFPFNLNFLQGLHATKKMGAIIDISNKSIFRENSRAASTVAQYLASLLASNGEHVLCLEDQDPKQKVSLAGQGKENKGPNIISEKESEGSLTIERNSTFLSHRGEFHSTERNLDEFQKVIIPINFQRDDLLKIKYAIKADFYVIMGKKGQIEFEKIKRFLVETSSLKSRCIGFILYS